MASSPMTYEAQGRQYVAIAADASIIEKDVEVPELCFGAPDSVDNLGFVGNVNV